MSTLPKPIVDKIREEQGTDPSKWSQEVQDLFNPSIQARPLELPLTGQIKLRLNRENEYFWALDRNGSTPYHARVEDLKSVGFREATTKDVEMFSADTVKSESEIRSGDRLLMAIPVMRWREIMKDRNMTALMKAYPHDTRINKDAQMNAANMIPGLQTKIADESVESIRSRAVRGEVKVDDTGHVTDFSGNATQYKKPKGEN